MKPKVTGEPGPADEPTFQQIKAGVKKTLAESSTEEKLHCRTLMRKVNGSYPKNNDRKFRPLHARHRRQSR
jgi:hypothetical protein